ncbi:MAG: ATP-binding protein [Sedimentisphaerales bacterium]|jgi:signal transduction histidine kinase
MNNAPDKSTLSPTDSGCSEVEELSRLLGVIAHEIKNPLSTIKVNLRLVDEDLSTAPAGDIDQRFTRARRKLAVIDKEAARLEQILDGFLRYADRTQPRLSPVDLNALVGDMVDFYLPQAAAHSITMRQSLHKEPLSCHVDAGMLKQAILNLFINAQQAIGAGGELMVRTAPVGKFAQIQISDTGKGISSDRLARIFEPYQSSRPGGTGLGLATVKKIIDAHKGTISVVSEPGKGTAFTISLSLSAAKSEAPR